MAATCIVGPSHPHTIHSAHTSHHQLLAALLPPNPQIPHLSHHHFSPGLGPHLSILHEATRNHIQLALHHTPSGVNLHHHTGGPPPPQFSLPSPTAPQQISLSSQAQLSLQQSPVTGQLSFSSPPTPQLSLPSPAVAAAQQITLPGQGPINVPHTPSAPRVAQSLAVKLLTSTGSPPTPTSLVLSSSSTPAPPTRPQTHEPSELRTL